MTELLVSPLTGMQGRVQRELQAIIWSKQRHYDYVEHSFTEDKRCKLVVVMSQLENCPYENATFPIQITYPPGYPMFEPKVEFLCRVYHPLLTTIVDDDSVPPIMSVFSSYYNIDHWSPTKTILIILDQVRNFLVNCMTINHKDCQITDGARCRGMIVTELLSDPILFESKAKQMSCSETKTLGFYEPFMQWKRRESFCSFLVSSFRRGYDVLPVALDCCIINDEDVRSMQDPIARVFHDRNMCRIIASYL